MSATLTPGATIRWGSFVGRLVEPCVDDGVPDMCHSEEHDGVPMQVWRVLNLKTERETFLCEFRMVEDR